MSRIVIALGGNALQRKGGAGAYNQMKEATLTAHRLVPLIKQGHQIVIVHGNGPQVGDILLHEEAIDTVELPSKPLDVCVAMSQGMIGYWLQQAIDNELRAENVRTRITTLITQVLVDRNDTAFSNPSKPIGPFYKDETEAQKVAAKKGFVVKPDADRGWRRVVASPQPKKIIEEDTIDDLMNQGCVVIAAGGGGIPVVDKEDGLLGVEAVIDKDASAATLAGDIGADMLLILTSIDNVKLKFGTPDEVSLGRVTCEQMRKYASEGEFAVGSMLPKVEAAVRFVGGRRGVRRAIIAGLDSDGTILKDNIGTEIV